METIKFLQGFYASKEGAEYHFKKGSIYTVEFDNDDVVSVFVDDAEDLWDGSIELPRNLEGEAFEFVDDSEEDYF